MRVEIGGQVVEFPEGMSEEEISKASATIYAQMQQQSAPPQSGNEMGRFGRFWQGMADPVVGAAQLLERSVPEAVREPINRADRWLYDNTQGFLGNPGGADQFARDREEWYRSQAPEGFDGARIAGNVVTGASLATKIPVGVGMGAKMGFGALGGGVGGAMMPTTGAPEDFWTDKALQTGVGAGMGTASPLVSGAAARVINPRAARNPDVALLRGAGVKPTAAQVAGGAVDTAEEMASSIPIGGSALDQFNLAAINRSVQPVGREVTRTGQAGIDQAARALDDAYDAARSALGGPVLVTNNMRQGISTLRQESGTLTKTMQEKFLRELDEGIASRMQRMSISPDDYKVIDSKLGQLSRLYGKSQNAEHQELAKMFVGLRTTLREGLEAQNPDAYALFRQADTGYANLMVVQNAANRAVNNAGVFTPGQLGMSVRAADESVSKGATARGSALMQDLATAGQNVLGNTTPNSFTTDRAGMMALLGASGYAMSGMPGSGAAATGLGTLAGGAGAYLALNPMLRFAISHRPQAAGLLEALVRDAGHAATPGLGMGAAGLLDR
jgi:hypothetical protein